MSATPPGPDCVFCAIAAGRAPAHVIRSWPETVAIVPHHPVTPGHWLVLPRVHVRDATTAPAVTAATMHRAAELVAETGDQANLITSIGPHATQTVWHLHIHIVPRQSGDNLPLPWTPQHQRARAAKEHTP